MATFWAHSTTVHDVVYFRRIFPSRILIWKVSVPRSDSRYNRTLPFMSPCWKVIAKFSQLTAAAAAAAAPRDAVTVNSTTSLMPPYWKGIAKFAQLAAAAAVPRRAAGVSSLGWAVLSLSPSSSFLSAPSGLLWLLQIGLQDL